MQITAMSDQNFHEIQLSGKQLVFLFISAVGVAVVIFLLGVSVGRGVREVALAGAGVDTGAPGDTVVATNPPPATPAPGELSYHDTLQGQGRAGRGTPPAAPPEPPPQQQPPAATAQTPPPASPATPQTNPAPPQTNPAPPPQQSAAPPPKTPPPAPADKPADTASKAAPKPSANGRWDVQVMALRSKEGADKLASDLKSKGYPAFVANPARGLYRVRVGPFAKRAEAEQIAARLAREGYSSPAVQAR
jgi:DedD protein